MTLLRVYFLVMAALEAAIQPSTAKPFLGGLDGRVKARP